MLRGVADTCGGTYYGSAAAAIALLPHLSSSDSKVQSSLIRLLETAFAAGKTVEQMQKLEKGGRDLNAAFEGARRRAQFEVDPEGVKATDEFSKNIRCGQSTRTETWQMRYDARSHDEYTLAPPLR